MKQPEGNFFDKYNNSNKIVKYLMNGFFSSIKELLKDIKFKNVMEAGCGEGYVSDFVYRNYRNLHIDSFDISEKVINQAKKDFPYINFSTGSIYKIECEDNTYDLVIASEVLEHLEEPQRALKELMRISKRYILLSVPNEPIWRILNMARGKYIKDFGNTPGHIQNWNKKTFLDMIGREAI